MTVPKALDRHPNRRLWEPSLCDGADRLVDALTSAAQNVP